VTDEAPGGIATSGARCLEVLVVDDDATIRALLSEVVTAHGHRVTGAAHGGEAWCLLATRHYDLVLLDVVMPVVNGIELLGRLSSRAPRPAVVVMSGPLSRENEEVVLGHGVLEVLTKPFSMSRVVEVLDAVAEDLMGRTP
jgi:two-component system response regulator (stage 0 sporulation protein F)